MDEDSPYLVQLVGLLLGPFTVVISLVATSHGDNMIEAY